MPAEKKPQGEAGARLSFEQLSRRITANTYVVVATMGAYDEEALEEVVGAGGAYVALVASRKRADAVFAYLRDRGVGEGVLQRVKVPAGLDIGAVTPEEIALSIMAEIIQVRRARPTATPVVPLTGPREIPPAEEATDPICGMTVEIAGARHIADYQGSRFYFCSVHCKHTFEQEPAKYAPARA